jgi:broad specificity phosphatase PhoE
MARLILVRHGESEGNRDRVFTASPEVPITDAGRAQVRATGEWIVGRYAPVRLVSSPFRRARQTAEILADTFALPVTIEDNLRERSYGALAGQPYTAARTCTDYDPAAYWDWCPPGGGETLIDVARRAGATLDRIARATPPGDVLVVSHGAVMVGLWWHVTGVWRPGRVTRNAGVVVVEHEEGRYLEATAVEDV